MRLISPFSRFCTVAQCKLSTRVFSDVAVSYQNQRVTNGADQNLLCELQLRNLGFIYYPANRLFLFSAEMMMMLCCSPSSARVRYRLCLRPRPARLPQRWSSASALLLAADDASSPSSSSPGSNSSEPGHLPPPKMKGEEEYVSDREWELRTGTVCPCSSASCVSSHSLLV